MKYTNGNKYGQFKLKVGDHKGCAFLNESGGRKRKYQSQTVAVPAPFLDGVIEGVHDPLTLQQLVTIVAEKGRKMGSGL